MSFPKLIVSTSIEGAGLPKEFLTPSADVHHVLGESFGINEARELTEKSSRKAFIGSSQVFIILARSLTTEAQNALLKLFEDSPQNADFFLIIPHESILLSTLRSRFITLEQQTVVGKTLAEEFISLNYADRMTLIAEKNKAKDQAWMDQLVSELGKMSRVLDHDSRKSLLLAESYIRNRGSSRKVLLEDLALSLPI